MGNTSVSTRRRSRNRSQPILLNMFDACEVKDRIFNFLFLKEIAVLVRCSSELSTLHLTAKFSMHEHHSVNVNIWTEFLSQFPAHYTRYCYRLEGIKTSVLRRRHDFLPRIRQMHISAVHDISTIEHLNNIITMPFIKALKFGSIRNVTGILAQFHSSSPTPLQCTAITISTSRTILDCGMLPKSLTQLNCSGADGLQLKQCDILKSLPLRSLLFPANMQLLESNASKLAIHRLGSLGADSDDLESKESDLAANRLLSLLPSGLLTLHLPAGINAKRLEANLQSLPAALTELVIPGVDTSQLQSHVLPATLRKLSIALWASLPRRVLPSSINSLDVCDIRLAPSSTPILKQVSPARSVSELSKLTSLTLSAAFHWPISPPDLPASLTELRFDCEHGKFNHRLLSYDLPAGLTRLELSRDFNQPCPEIFPPGLRYLKFGNEFDHPLCLAATRLQSLIFASDSKFNQPFTQGRFILPQTLTQLEFGRESQFNQPIQREQLPQSLTTIKFGARFNQFFPICVFGQNLAYLQLGRRYSYPFHANVLPASLTTLNLADCPALPVRPFVASLPPNLTCLNLSAGGPYRIAAGILPASLTKLECGQFFDEKNPDCLRPGVISQCAVNELGHNVLPLCLLQPGSLPITLESLCLDNGSELSAGVLPPSLLRLEFGACASLSGGILPRSLTELHLFGQFNSPLLPGVLPGCLRMLLIRSDKFNEPFSPGSLPEGLIQFDILCRNFDQPLLAGVLPKSLKSLAIASDCHDDNASFNANVHFHENSQLQKLCIHSKAFNQPLPAPLPSTLRALELKIGKYDHRLTGVLPAHLEELVVGGVFTKPIAAVDFPLLLKCISCHSSFSQTAAVQQFVQQGLVKSVLKSSY